MEKLISIIIPAYNVDKWVGKCLNSVMNQSYSNLEIIVIDDGSDDDTNIICTRMAEKDKRITLIHQENKGVSEARNEGIRRSCGEYICFVDADDYIDPDYIKVLSDLIDNNHVQLSICGYVEEDEKGRINRTLKGKTGVQKSLTILESLFFHDEIGRSLWNKMFDNRLIKQQALLFSADFMVGEDMFFLIQYLTLIEKSALSDQIGYHYILREQSAMQKKYWDGSYLKNRLSWLNALDAVENFLKDKNLHVLKFFYRYKLLVYYRVLCESVSLTGEKSNLDRRALEKKLSIYVKRHGVPAVMSGMIPLATSVGILLCCISPKLQVLIAKTRRQ